MKKTVKICIYNKSSSKNDVLLGNGDAILDNICLECKVHENLDGTYEIDAEFIIDNEGLWQHIEEEAILKVRLDYGYEYFRITQPRKTSNRIIVYGRQATIYETMHLWLTDVRPENQDGAGALHWILDNATGIKELEVMSDIETTSTAYYMDMNMYEALHDCDQSFFNRWGGEIQRRGYILRINQRIGTDRGVEIRSRKNLTGFEANTNIDNVVTRIKPKGFDGITIDGYVDSEYINKYPRIKTKEIKYEDVKLKDENNPDGGYETLAEAQAELTRLAKLEYTDNKIDVITAEYNISFVDLSKTEEYKDYVQAERVYLGDTVNVYEEKLDINVSVRAIDRVYDVLGERVEEIKLSNKDINKLHSMNDILTDILKGVQENDNSLQLYIQKIINSGIQDSYVFYNKAELVICDSPEIENAINVWRFNRGGLAHSSNGYSGPYNVAITYDGKINADMILAGLIKGNYIDARNLTVTRTDGTKTLEVTAGGDVNLNVNSLKIESKDVATKEYANSYTDSQITTVNNSINAKVETVYNSGITNIIPYAYFKYPETIKNTWTLNNVTWYEYNGKIGIQNNTSSEGYVLSPAGMVTDRVVSLYVDMSVEKNCSSTVYLVGSTKTTIQWDWVMTCFTYSSGEYVAKKVENIELPSNLKTLYIQISNTSNGNTKYNVVFPNKVNLVTGSKAKSIDLSSANQLAKLSIDTDGIKTEVSKKVGNTEIISKINQSPESISIDANKVNLNGYVTISNLTDGTTTISGENIKTGHIQGISLDACYLQGKTMVYIQDNGILSCDGQTYIRDFYVPNTHDGWMEGSVGSFSVEPAAYFGSSIHATGKVYSGEGTTIVSNPGDLYMVDSLSIQNTGGPNWMKIVTPEGKALGVDLWESDANLKENIVDIENPPSTVQSYSLSKNNTNNITSTIGLDTINAINHYSFNFKPETKIEGTIECGYISQQLQEVNPMFVRSIEQDDNTTILEPVASMLIPYLSKAIKELSSKIDELENKIASMQEKESGQI